MCSVSESNYITVISLASSWRIYTCLHIFSVTSVGKLKIKITKSVLMKIVNTEWYPFQDISIFNNFLLSSINQILETKKCDHVISVSMVQCRASYKSKGNNQKYTHYIGKTNPIWLSRLMLLSNATSWTLVVWQLSLTLMNACIQNKAWNCHLHIVAMDS